MKKTFIISILTLLTFTYMKGQNALVKTNVIGLITGSYGIIVEIPLNDSRSIELGGNIVNNKVDNTDGFSASVDYRFYFDSPTRFFAAPFLEYASLKDENEFKTTIFGIGAIGGYQYLSLNENNTGFVIDLFAGPVIGIVDKEKHTYEYNDSGMFDGFGLAYGVSVGFVF